MRRCILLIRFGNTYYGDGTQSFIEPKQYIQLICIAIILTPKQPMNNDHNKVLLDINRNTQQLNKPFRVISIPSCNYQQSSQSIVKKNTCETPSKTQPKVVSRALNSSSELYTCRICLQQSPFLHADDQDQLKELIQKLREQCSQQQPKYVINTCKCQGTSGYVHQRCILKWIEELSKRTKQKTVRCQICLEEILYEKRTIGYFQFTIKKCESISPCNIFCLSLTAMVLAGCISLITQSQQLGMNDLAKITIIIFILLLSMALLLSLVVILKETFYRKRIQMGRVFTKDEVQINGLHRDSLRNQETIPSTQITQLRVGTFRSVGNIYSGRDQLIMGNREWQMSSNWYVDPQVSSPYELNQQEAAGGSLRRTIPSVVDMIRVQILSGEQLFQ